MDWGQSLHTRIAAAIRAARGNRSAQQLADGTARLGYPVSRSQIANYENGRKHSLDIAELLILAAALEIPPSLLLFPTFPDGPVEVIPGHETTAETALQWLSGAAPLSARVTEAGGAVAATAPAVIPMTASALVRHPANAGTKLVGAVAQRALWDDLLTTNQEQATRYRRRPKAAEILGREAAELAAQRAEANVAVQQAKAQLWGTDEEGTDG
jgi:transcriptional regulator with XRE-family HTH domain